MSAFLGITREQVFSPGRVDDDRAILMMVAEQLRRRGHLVSVCDADDAAWPEPTRDTVVFAMCQGDRALDRLQQWQQRGVRIVNSPQAILNCQRHRTIAAFEAAAIPSPESVLRDTASAALLPAWLGNGGAWIKRGDVHATEPDDVVQVQNATAARDALQRFRQRGVRQAVVQQHVPGIVVKFYGVARRFFHCVPPKSGAAVSTDGLRLIETLGQRAARVLALEIYGGDCVVSVNDRLSLIDLNDWPSYAPCRAEAATEIAAYLHAREVASGQ